MVGYNVKCAQYDGWLGQVCPISWLIIFLSMTNVMVDSIYKYAQYHGWLEFHIRPTSWLIRVLIMLNIMLDSSSKYYAQYHGWWDC